MVDRRGTGDRRQGERRRGSGANRTAGRTPTPAAGGAPVHHGWTIVAHPQLLTQLEKLAAAVGAEKAKSGGGAPGPNEKLFGHLMDLALEKIPQNPASPAFRHGYTLGIGRTHWFRGKTGNGRYRLFFRYHSKVKVIILAWVNDEDSLRTYGSSTDAYAIFRGMLDDDDPPDDWDALLREATKAEAAKRWSKVAASKASAPPAEPRVARAASRKNSRGR